jgi:Tol biopolymer transport system component
MGTPPVQRAAPARFVQLTDFPGAERWPSLSPDGQSIAYAAVVGGNEDIHVLRVGGRNPVNLTADSAAADSLPAFSPDGSRIAFRSERSGGGIFVMGATGESVRRATDFGFAPSWSPDGSELVVSTSNFAEPFSRNISGKLFAVKVATGERRLIDDGDAVQPAWSPNGHRVAFWGLATGRTGLRDIWTVPAAGPEAGSRVSVTNDAATDWYPQWSADGRWLYFLSDRGGVMNVWRVPIDESSGRVLGDAESVVAPALALSGITFARNGQMAYATVEHRSTIERLMLDPVREQIVGAPDVVLRESRRIAYLDWSPDGEWLAFSTTGTRENIFLVRPDGSGYRQVTDDEFRNRGPVWSSDGSRFAFFSNRSGLYQVWTVNPDGSGLRQISNADQGVSSPVWSPARDQLAVVTMMETRGWSLFDLGAGKPISTPQLTGATSDTSYFLPLAWSPDGASIAGVHAESQRSVGETSARYPVYIYSVRDRTYRPLEASGGVLWMSDSRRLLVYDNTDIAIVDSQTGRRKIVLRDGDRQNLNQFWRVSLTRDDRRIAVVTDDVEGNLWTIRDR